jgi:hypothetical protein
MSIPWNRVNIALSYSMAYDPAVAPRVVRGVEDQMVRSWEDVPTRKMIKL